jgi:MFS family permease
VFRIKTGGIKMFASNSIFKRENLNLALFSSGKLISLFGSAVYTFAVGLHLLEITSSGLNFALNIILYTLPIIFVNPIAGIAADKFDKKIIVIGSDLLNALFLTAVYFITFNIRFSPLIIYLSTFLINVFAAFFNVAIESAKPSLVGKDKLYNINSISRIIESVSHLLGPVIGGVVYSLFDIRAFILINALSFFLAAVLEYFIDYEYNIKEESQIGISNLVFDGAESSQMKSLIENIKLAFNYIILHKYLKGLLLIFAALNFFFNFSVIVPVPYLLNTIWQIDSSLYGIIQAAFPAGMISGALIVKRVVDNYSYSGLLKRISYIIVFMVPAFSAPLLIFSKRPEQQFILIYYLILMYLSGVVVSWVDIPANTIIQKIVPDELLGRVISLNLSIIKIIVPLSLFLSGYLLDMLSPVNITLSAAIIFLVFNLYFYNSEIGKNFMNIELEKKSS